MEKLVEKSVQHILVLDYIRVFARTGFVVRVHSHYYFFCLFIRKKIAINIDLN